MAIINGIQSPQISEQRKQELEKKFLSNLPQSCCEWKVQNIHQTFDMELETPVLIFKVECLKCGARIVHRVVEKEIKE